MRDIDIRNNLHSSTYPNRHGYGKVERR